MFNDSKFKKRKRNLYNKNLIHEKINKAKYMIDTQKRGIDLRSNQKEINIQNVESYANDIIKPLPKRYSRTEAHAVNNIVKLNTFSSLSVKREEDNIKVLEIEKKLNQDKAQPALNVLQSSLESNPYQSSKKNKFSTRNRFSLSSTHAKRLRPKTSSKVSLCKVTVGLSVGGRAEKLRSRNDNLI